MSQRKRTAEPGKYPLGCEPAGKEIRCGPSGSQLSCGRRTGVPRTKTDVSSDLLRVYKMCKDLPSILN